MKQTKKQLEKEKERARRFLKSIEMEVKHPCNQCGYKMEDYGEKEHPDLKNQVFECINPACSNYGIQVCVQDMDNIGKTKS